MDGTWTFAGRDTTSPATAGFEFLYRDFTSDIPPVALFTQAGKLFPLAYYDYFPLKNFRSDFMDAIHAATFVIPLPDRGLGGYGMYRPTSQHYVRIGVHDANADAEEFDFDVFDDGELFSIIESMRGRPLSGILDGSASRAYGDKDFVGGEMQNGKWMRQGDFKAVSVAPPCGTGTWHLYDLANDPGETTDLAASQPDKLRRLQGAWQSYAEEVGVILTE